MSKEKDIRICILQRGRVVVGEYETDGIAGFTRATRGACVRRWGTDAGLGQLAQYGPTDTTQLDYQPDTEWPTLAMVETIKCNYEVWAPLMKDLS